ncbi:MAG TPA: cyanoexosortase A system-associated protein [Candidatus Obscuribacterales bacterium]
MTSWSEYRQVMIKVTFAGVFLTLVRFIFDPTAGNRPVKPFTFPSAVEVPRWQLVESSPLAEPLASSQNSLESVLANRKYLYRQNDQQLEIKMRYMVATTGNFPGYFKDGKSIEPSTEQILQGLRQREGTGFYSIFSDEKQLHLIACINSRGGSTVTTPQFAANRNTYDMKLSRLLPWLVGNESLRDRRCLWTHMSTPLNQASAQSANLALEQAWLPWYQWWSTRFPQH